MMVGTTILCSVGSTLAALLRLSLWEFINEQG